MDKIVEFSGNHTLLVLGLVVSIFAVIFYELRRKSSGLLNVEPTAAVQLINNDALIVDLRSVDAFAKGHIVGAKNIPSDELESKINTLDAAKSKPIVAVCDTGVSSTKAVNALRAAGYESVYGLQGGMGGWTQAGLPVVSGKKTKPKKSKNKG